MHDLRILARDRQGQAENYLIERAPGFQLVRRMRDTYHIFLPWSYYHYIDFNNQVYDGYVSTGQIMFVSGSQKRRDTPNDLWFQLPIPTVTHWVGLACTRAAKAQTFHERLGLAFDNLFFDPGVDAIDTHFSAGRIPQLVKSMGLPCYVDHAGLLKTWEESSPRRVRNFALDLMEMDSRYGAAFYVSRIPKTYKRIPLDKFAP